MCSPTLVAYGIAGASAASSYTQGRAARSSAEAQAEQMRYEGRERARAGAYKANLEKQAQDRLLATQRAAYAANGIDPNTASAGSIQDQTLQSGALDRQSTLYNAMGQRDALYNQANQTEFQGRQAHRQGNIGAGTSLLGAVGGAYLGNLSNNQRMISQSTIANPLKNSTITTANDVIKQTLPLKSGFDMFKYDTSNPYFKNIFNVNRN